MLNVVVLGVLERTPPQRRVVVHEVTRVVEVGRVEVVGDIVLAVDSVSGIPGCSASLDKGVASAADRITEQCVVIW